MFQTRFQFSFTVFKFTIIIDMSMPICENQISQNFSLPKIAKCHVKFNLQNISYLSYQSVTLIGMEKPNIHRILGQTNYRNHCKS